MEKAWRNLYNYSKKEAVKQESIYLKGVRSMEATIRPAGLFHYHIHMIVDGWANAEWILKEWLKRNPESSEKAQNIRPADKGALIEVFKYSVKMSVDLQKNGNLKRLDELFRVLKGKRTISTFGGLKTAKIDVDEEMQLQAQASEKLKLRLGNDHSVWNWHAELYDWINEDTGELLIGEDLPKKIKEIIGKKQED